MAILKDLFGKVSETLRKAFTVYEVRVADASDEIAALLLTAMRANAPDGSENLDKYAGNQWSPSRIGQRPSERLGERPIASSLSFWGAHQVVDVGAYRSGIEISTDAHHTLFFTKGIPEGLGYGGTRPHRIPSAPEIMAVHRGYPLAFHFEKIGQDVWIWSWVNHPGIRLENIGGDFVEKSVDEVEEDARQVCRDHLVDDFFDELWGELRG